MLRFYRFGVAYGALMAVYPLFKVLCDSVSGRYQRPAMFLLQPWKCLAKKFIVHFTRGLEDFVPEIAAFTVEFFSTLYVSVCLFNSGSVTVAARHRVGCLQSAVELRELHTNASVVEDLFRDRWPVQGGTSDLVALILGVVRVPDDSNIRRLGTVRHWACLPHPISIERVEPMARVQASGVFGLQGMGSHPHQTGLASIMPQPLGSVTRSPDKTSIRKPLLPRRDWRSWWFKVCNFFFIART
jgi:hypothetical protein